MQTKDLQNTWKIPQVGKKIYIQCKFLCFIFILNVNMTHFINTSNCRLGGSYQIQRETDLFLNYFSQIKVSSSIWHGTARKESAQVIFSQMGLQQKCLLNSYNHLIVYHLNLSHLILPSLPIHLCSLIRQILSKRSYNNLHMGFLGEKRQKWTSVFFSRTLMSLNWENRRRVRTERQSQLFRLAWPA